MPPAPTSPQPAQTLLSGNPIGSQPETWGWGITRCRAIPPLSALWTVILGGMGCGKSALIYNCPNSAIFNFDRSQISTTREEDHRAAVWPWINEEGQTCDSNKQPFLFTWERVMEKAATLIELAKNNRPRPRTVIFDSMSAALELATAHAMRHLPPEKQTQQAKFSLAANIYLQVALLIESISRAGYGVIIIAHIGEDNVEYTDPSKAEDDPNRKYKTRRLVVKLPSSIQDAILGKANLIVRMEKRLEQAVTTVIDRREIAGRVLETPRNTYVQVQKYFLLTVDKEMPNIVKSRVAATLPNEIEIPSTSPWEALNAVYDNAVKSSL